MENITKMIEKHGEVIGPIGIAIYSILIIKKGNNKSVDISTTEIARSIGLKGRKTVTNHVKRLIEKGLIRKETRVDEETRRVMNSRYWILK